MGACTICSVRTGKSSGISFHRFPLKKNPALAEKWAQWVSVIKKRSWVPSKTSVLCSNHFEESAFDRSAFRVELNANSVPTINDSNNNSVKVSGIQETKHPTSTAKKTIESSPQKSCQPNDLLVSSASTDNTSLTLPNINETQKKSPAAVETDITPSTPITSTIDQCGSVRRRALLLHDHNYEDTPMTCEKKNRGLKEKLHKLQVINRVQKQQIKRMHKKMQSLKQLIKTLQEGQDQKISSQYTVPETNVKDWITVTYTI